MICKIIIPNFIWHADGSRNSEELEVSCSEDGTIKQVQIDGLGENIISELTNNAKDRIIDIVVNNKKYIQFKRKPF